MRNLQIHKHKANPIPITHNDEVGKLTACFNEMVENPIEREQQSLLQFHNVTGQAIAEQRSKLLELMFDQNQGGIFVLDRRLNVTTQNAAAMDWFGKLKHIKGLPLRSPLLLSQKQTRRLLKNGFVVNNVEIEHRTKCWLFYEMKASVFKGLADGVEAFVISLTNLSVGIELKRLSFKPTMTR
ncbi:hypothetical protein ACPV40_13785 [Vibrio alfacsensis]|uniref:hypothetical protein n=1 Tax=Vibrio TaxID=662 RepID=UPI00406769DF